MLWCFLVGIAAAALWRYARQGLKDRWDAIWIWKRFPRCLGCGSWTGLSLESSRTMYNYDGPWDSPNNPNHPVLLCVECAKDHHDYWDGMWADYYNGLM